MDLRLFSTSKQAKEGRKRESLAEMEKLCGVDIKNPASPETFCLCVAPRPGGKWRRPKLVQPISDYM